MIRALLLLPILAGCRVDTTFDSVATEVVPGIYQGPLDFVIKAKFGPFRVGMQDCRAPLTFDVDPDWFPEVLGLVSCDMGKYGVKVIEVSGTTGGFPDVDGRMEGGDVRADWIGAFTADGVLEGVADGTQPWRGSVRLHYEGGFEAVWVAPLEDHAEWFDTDVYTLRENRDP